MKVKANPKGEMKRLQQKFTEGKLLGRDSIRIAQQGKFSPHTTIKLDRKYSDSKDNIENLPHGNVDVIIFSPPYADAQEGGGIAKIKLY